MKTSLSKADPTAALTKTRAEHAALERRLVELRGQRADALLSDGVPVIEQFDTSIAATERRLVILDDQTAALRGELAKRRHAERERDRAAAITALEARLANKNECAKALEAALAALGSSFTEYRRATSDVFTDWPADLLGPVEGYSSADGVARQIGSALGIQSGAPDVRIAEVGARVGRLAENTAAASAAIIAALKASPPPDIPERIEEAA